MAAHGLRGFTLVEVLVALSLLALTGVIAWRGLDQVSSQRARADAETLATDRVLRSLAQMERDFGQHIPDALFAAPTDTAGTLPRAVKVFVGAEGNIRLDVLRRLPSPHGVRNVAYSVEGSSLVRQLLTAPSDPRRGGFADQSHRCNRAMLQHDQAHGSTVLNT